MTRPGTRIFLASVLALVVIGWAAPAFAQNGTIMGRVVDSDRRATDRDGKPIGGKPKDIKDQQMGVDQAYVYFELKGDKPRKFEAITDAYGEFYKSGLPPGTYDITVKKEWRDPIQGRAPGNKPVIFVADAMGVVLKPGDKMRIPDMGALTEEARAAGKRAPVASNMSNSEAAEANKRAAELETMLKDANAAVTAGKHEDAIKMFESFAAKQAEKNEKCAACFVKIGESYVKLNNLEKAEEAFKKAITEDDKLPAPYSQLAAIYNGQRKFEDAAKMSAKANELAGAGAAAGGGGGGDATSLYNDGIINWNAGKYPEARDAFARAVKADPRHANAQYYLGMAIFNLATSGKATLTDARAPFQEYLKLAPNGEFAPVAKAMLANIK